MTQSPLAASTPKSPRGPDRHRLAGHGRPSPAGLSGQGPRGPDGPVRILIVDDDARVVAHTRGVLEREGYLCAGVCSGVDALARVADWLPHLVLLGWGLPDLDGREVCRRIKGDVGMPDCLVVMASESRASGDDQVAGLESGADGYLVRPIADRELVAWVHAFVRILKLNLELRAQAARRLALEESLREKQEMYRILAEGIKDVVWTLDPRTLRFLYMSPSVQRLTGFTVEEALGRPAPALLSESAGTSVSGRIRRRAMAYATGKAPQDRFYTDEMELACKDGGTVWTETVASFDRDPRNGRIVLRGVTRDIRERKSSEAALAESHRQLAALMDNLPGLAYRCRNDPDWTMELMSGGCLALTGYAPEFLLAPGTQRYARIMHPEDRVRVWDEVQAALAERRRYELEYRIVTAAGAEKWVWESGRGLFDGSGELLALEGLVLDIDPRRRAEAALQERECMLEQAQRAASLGHYVYSPGDDRWNSSQVLDEIFGIGPDYPRTLEGWLALVHPEERADLALYLERQVLGAGEPFDRDYRILRCGDGEERWLHGSGLPELGPDGRAVRLVGIIQDITARCRAETEVRQLNAELERRVRRRTAALEAANADLESFTYSVSHDLRAPLRAICGFAQALDRRYRERLDADGRHYLDQVIAGGDRMGALIEDLLAYSRTGRDAVRCVPVDLGPLAAGLASTFSERIAACAAELEIREPLATPLGDPTLIGQILVNLVENALTYTCRQGVPRIQVAAIAEGAEVIVRVTDNGIGIAPADQGRIFKVFQRLHGEDAYPGTGIGLAIVSKAVRLMGGRVELRSALGRGSTFGVRLPAAPARDGD